MATTFDKDGHVHLTDQRVMWKVLLELVGDNASEWRGGITAWPEGTATGPAHWRIELNDWEGHGVSARTGDHLVKVYGEIIAITDEKFQRTS